jgi:hypothetical protein
LALLPLAAEAQEIHWENQKSDVNVTPTDTEAVGLFKFENVGDQQLTIDSVNTSCGCTTAAPSKKSFAPHEKGEIRASMEIGDRLGSQEKAIIVKTNDRQHPDSMLTLKVSIPQMAQVTPMFLHWQRNEPAKPKVVTLKPLNGYPIKKLSVRCSDARFIAQVDDATDAQKEFHITVTPPNIPEALGAILTISTDFPAERPKQFLVNLWLK